MKFVVFALSRSKAGLRKGCIAVPLSQRVANGGVKQKFFTCGEVSHYIHDSIK